MTYDSDARSELIGGEPVHGERGRPTLAWGLQVEGDELMQDERGRLTLV